MAGETVITVVGNLTADPDMRFTPSGAAVANFTIASTPRTFDRSSSEWKEGETLFLRASVWREAAENVAETLRKGMRVIAQGVLRSRSYETKEGERRTSMELEILEIGPSLRFASANVNRNQRAAGNNFSGQQGSQQQGQNQQSGYQGGQTQQQVGYQQQNQQQGGYNQPPQGGQPPQGNQQPQGNQGANPWGNQQGGNYDWGTLSDEEPPF